MQRDLRWNHLPAGKKKKESEAMQLKLLAWYVLNC